MRKTAIKFAISLIVLVILIVSLMIPVASLPSFSNLLNPKTGIWSTSTQSPIVGYTNHTVEFDGKSAKVQVYQEQDGFTAIASNQTWATFYEQGYLTAKYRLLEMDLFRRTIQGNMSAILGSSFLPSDKFYRSLGMYQVAQESAILAKQNASFYSAITNFTAGVNSYIDSLNSGNLPLMFRLIGYTPGPWKLADTFAIQELLTWELSGSTDPVGFNSALTHMPESVIKAFYPTYPASVQSPIDPSSMSPSIYNGPGDINTLSLYTPNPVVNSTNLTGATTSFLGEISNASSAFNSISSDLMGVNPFDPTSFNFNDKGSNNWAVSPSRTNDNGSILANDPHLTTTLPSIWIGFQLVAPGLNVVGVTFPGVPGIILGHNPYLAWGATDGESQQVYYYADETSTAHPGKYYFDGSWVPFVIKNETIPVKGSRSVPFTYTSAVNGAIVTEMNQTLALDWTGLSPGDEGFAVYQMDYAKTITQFKEALNSWSTGIQNWVVSDNSGNIGIFSFGKYPIISQGNPRGILPGTGQYNWTGFIPQQYQPQTYDPSSGYVVSANQVPVSSNYNYYVGWLYESGYRANQISFLLDSSRNYTVKNMESVQLNVHDYSTNIFLNPLIHALKEIPLNNTGKELLTQLESWNGDFSLNSTAATLYYYWLYCYLNDTFLPWLQYYNITEKNGLYSYSFFLGSDAFYHGPLVEDLANWTVNHPDITWFDNPISGVHGNSSVLMGQAFDQAIGQLFSTYGNLDSWKWGMVHDRSVASLLGISALSYQNIPAAGDSNTINAAYGLNSTSGPSWRMIVDMINPLSAVGIYPGGTTENPLSNYYSNTVLDWNQGNYYVLIPANIDQTFHYLYPGGGSP